MNIFAIDSDPQRAAIHLHDRHVVKMTLESAQLISTTRRWFGDQNPLLYSPTHIMHPSNIWLRESINNYLWLCRYFKALCEEYRYRYRRAHRSEFIIGLMGNFSDDMLPMTDTSQTPFALAMPDEYKVDNPVQSYRNYYLGEKIQDNFWTMRRFELDDWLVFSLFDSQYKERKGYVNRRPYPTPIDDWRFRMVEKERASDQEYFP